MSSRCEKCNAIVPAHLEKCAFCEGKKATTAVKSLFGILVQDVKNVAAKFNKVRVKTDHEDKK